MDEKLLFETRGTQQQKASPSEGRGNLYPHLEYKTTQYTVKERGGEESGGKSTSFIGQSFSG